MSIKFVHIVAKIDPCYTEERWESGKLIRAPFKMLPISYIYPVIVEGNFDLRCEGYKKFIHKDNVVCMDDDYILPTRLFKVPFICSTIILEPFMTLFLSTQEEKVSDKIYRKYIFNV